MSSFDYIHYHQFFFVIDHIKECWTFSCSANRSYQTSCVETISVCLTSTSSLFLYLQQSKRIFAVATIFYFFHVILLYLQNADESSRHSFLTSFLHCLFSVYAKICASLLLSRYITLDWIGSYVICCFLFYLFFPHQFLCTILSDDFNRLMSKAILLQNRGLSLFFCPCTDIRANKSMHDFALRWQFIF